MSKYSPLGEFLKDQSAAQVPMTFKEIERLTGHKLPASALLYRAWWSNNPRNSVVTQVWLVLVLKASRSTWRHAV
jgi:hypothetical protein